MISDVSALCFMGYKRSDGSVGVRNHVLILPSIFCVDNVAAQIARTVRGTVAVQHDHGCGQLGIDIEQTARTLIGIGKNPNVASVVVVGLGCEQLSAPRLAAKIAESGKPTAHLVVQDDGGILQTIAKGSRVAGEFVREASRLTREPAPLSALTIGTQCGGSDATSGMAANGALGVVSDRVIEAGGTVLLTETSEFVGAEHLLVGRAADEKVSSQIIKIVETAEARARTMGVDWVGSQPSPGNIVGGLTTIEEKSLGAIQKGGTASVRAVIKYAETPPTQGLVIMDTSSDDVASPVGMAAGGAQVILFTTGRGTPVGLPICPVIKITGNAQVAQAMAESIDFNASPILNGISLVETGQRLFQELLEVLNGKFTYSEVFGFQDFSIDRLGPVI
jgi:altronate dehydratase large subunit